MQIFRPAATTVFRALIAAALLAVCSGGYGLYAYYHSPWWNRQGWYRMQPVLFSHRHHAGELHIDCRYCHATVETSAFAGMPSTRTCLTCHSQIFTDTPMLRPVVASAVNDQPIPWRRVNALPDHVYFNHSIQIARGLACARCHGAVTDMPLMAKGATLEMRFCIQCHRDPGPAAHGHGAHLQNCSTCHR